MGGLKLFDHAEPLSEALLLGEILKGVQRQHTTKIGHNELIEIPIAHQIIRLDIPRIGFQDLLSFSHPFSDGTHPIGLRIGDQEDH